jgi:23S rRNA pseudouridine1911/1915/1917 synthase
VPSKKVRSETVRHDDRPPHAPSAPTWSFVADPSLPLERADRALAAAAQRRLGEHPPADAPSRATLQRWIDEARVRIDGAACRSSSQRIPRGAVVQVEPAPPRPSEAVADANVAVLVVYEDEDLLVIDKPAGLVVHPARGHEDGTLVNGLLALGCFSADAADARDPAGLLRPGIVHRLDKGTSGLLVVAKNERTREALKASFARHEIEREYVALVVGVAQEARFDTPHGRHPSDRLRFTSLGRIGAAKRAVTIVRVLERLGPVTLVACRLETGRTHQIRVHLTERMKTPILGDPVYGAPPRDAALRALADQLGHQALHARVLGFAHPRTGRQLRFESALPDDLARAVEALRARAVRDSGPQSTTKRRARSSRS